MSVLIATPSHCSSSFTFALAAARLANSGSKRPLAKTALTNSTAFGSSTSKSGGCAPPLPARGEDDDCTARDLAYDARTKLGLSIDSKLAGVYQ
eukprot:5006387-Pleurochrysis_carterae.AAC.1